MIEAIELKQKLDRIEQLTLLSAKNVLTIEDASLLTALSKSHLYKLTCSQQIPHYKPNGKQIYFDRGELEDWLKQNRIQTISEIDDEALGYLFKGNKQERRGRHGK